MIDWFAGVTKTVGATTAAQTQRQLPQATLSIKMGILTVFLDRIENLTNRDLGTCSDPYVKFELEQDNFVSSSAWGFLLWKTSHPPLTTSSFSLSFILDQRCRLWKCQVFYQEWSIESYLWRNLPFHHPHLGQHGVDLQNQGWRCWKGWQFGWVQNQFGKIGLEWNPHGYWQSRGSQYHCRQWKNLFEAFLQGLTIEKGDGARTGAVVGELLTLEETTRCNKQWERLTVPNPW